MAVWRLLWIAAMASGALASRASLPPTPVQTDPPPAAPPSDERVLDRALSLLVEEATAAQAATRLEHEAPDFDTRFSGDIGSDQLSRAIVQRQDDDPFIDAYIRWQLTSFDPPLPEMDDATFLRMMDAAPPMIEHTRAAAGVLDFMSQVERAGVLSPRDTERLRKHVDSINHTAMLMEEMNRPAREWREWVAEKLGETGVRPRLWMVENLAARILAGWPVSDLKADISRDFSASVNDQSFTGDDRHAVILHLSRLIGPGRRYFHDVSYFADGRVDVTFRTVAVDRDDVENWRKRLAGIKID